MTAALQPGQYEIDGFTFGRGQNFVWIQNTSVDPGSATTQDTQLVGTDGIQFGVDTMQGLMITFTGNVYVPPHRVSEKDPTVNPIGVAGPVTQAFDQFSNHRSGYALNAFNYLAGKWNDPSVRLQDNAVVALRLRYPFSDSTRVVYGRGRKIMATYGFVHAGVVPFVAAFQAGDWAVYQDQVSSLQLVMQKQATLHSPPFAGGSGGPPVQTSTVSGQVVNTGSTSTWPVITFTGPCTNPKLSYPAAGISIGYRGFIAGNQTIVIDTRPWRRYAQLTTPEEQPWSAPALGGGVAAQPAFSSLQSSSNVVIGGGGGGSGPPPNQSPVAGLLTGNRMGDLSIPPGKMTVKFEGQDGRGRAKCSIMWQSAELAIGGVLT